MKRFLPALACALLLLAPAPPRAHGRAALALALTGMLRDGEVTRERASELARMVLRDNAANLYGIK